MSGNSDKRSGIGNQIVGGLLDGAIGAATGGRVQSNGTGRNVIEWAQNRTEAKDRKSETQETGDKKEPGLFKKLFQGSKERANDRIERTVTDMTGGAAEVASVTRRGIDDTVYNNNPLKGLFSRNKDDKENDSKDVEKDSSKKEGGLFSFLRKSDNRDERNAPEAKSDRAKESGEQAPKKRGLGKFVKGLFGKGADAVENTVETGADRLQDRLSKVQGDLDNAVSKAKDGVEDLKDSREQKHRDSLKADLLEVRKMVTDGDRTKDGANDYEAMQKLAKDFGFNLEGKLGKSSRDNYYVPGAETNALVAVIDAQIDALDAEKNVDKSALATAASAAHGAGLSVAGAAQSETRYHDKGDYSELGENLQYPLEKLAKVVGNGFDRAGDVALNIRDEALDGKERLDNGAKRLGNGVKAGVGKVFGGIKDSFAGNREDEQGNITLGGGLLGSHRNLGKAVHRALAEEGDNDFKDVKKQADILDRAGVDSVNVIDFKALKGVSNSDVVKQAMENFSIAVGKSGKNGVITQAEQDSIGQAANTLQNVADSMSTANEIAAQGK